MKSHAEDGVLVLTDISGFTAFVTATELDPGSRRARQSDVRRRRLRGGVTGQRRPQGFGNVFIAVFRAARYTQPVGSRV